MPNFLGHDRSGQVSKFAASLAVVTLLLSGQVAAHAEAASVASPRGSAASIARTVLPTSTPAPQSCELNWPWEVILVEAFYRDYDVTGETDLWYGAQMAVREDDTTTVEDESTLLAMRAAVTKAATDPADVVFATLDSDGDSVADYITYAPHSSLLDGCTATPIFSISGALETDTGHQAAWMRQASQYHVTLFWRELGLSSVQMAMKIVEPATTYDWVAGWSVELPYPPSAPQSVAVTPGDGTATLSWSLPARIGAPPLTGFRATATPGGASCTTATTSCPVTGLTNGLAYTFTVVAFGRVGESPPSAVAGPVTPAAQPAPIAPPLVPPSPPTGATAIAGDRSATVQWAPPVETGSHAITSYTVAASPGGSICTSSSATCAVLGLANGTAYKFTVRAHSAAGASPPSTPTAAVTPLPFAVVKVAARKSGGVLMVNVNPNKGRGYWKFRVEKLVGGTDWKRLKMYRTRGSKETRTINLKKGTYRVVVLAKYGHQTTMSAPVSLRK